MKNLRRFGAGALVLIASAGRVSALTENWSAQVTTFLTEIGGQIGVPSGDVIEIGLISNPAAAAAATSPNQLQSLVNVFASSTIGTGTGIDGSFTVASSAPGAGFFGGQIYLVVFQGTTVGTANEMMILTDSSWVFPVSDVAAPGNLDVGDAGVTALKGVHTFGTITSPSDIAGSDSFAFAVPEPSAWALVGVSLLAFLPFCRRR